MGNKKRNICKIIPVNPYEMVLHQTLVKIDYKKIKDLSTLRAGYRDAPWTFLADKLGVEKTFLANMVRQNHISLLYLRYIAEALQVNINELVDLGGFYYLLEK